MSQNSNLEDSEIDLREVFAALWAHKFFIVLFTILSIFFAGYYALTADKKYTAEAVFQVEEKANNTGFNFSGELGALASISGLSSGLGASSTDILIERASRREFILNMKERTTLELDPYFNTYNPDLKDPYWKAFIKRLIGWQKTDLEKNAIVENNITNNYIENVKFNITDGGAISISVTHVKPTKASNYANEIMEELRRLVESESFAAQRLRLNYLSETLADALQEMEQTQENLKNYTLKNSANAKENFKSTSLKLDAIRMEKRKVQEIADLLSIIQSLVKSGNLDSNSYQALKLSHPLVDDIDFRRILGMSETISAWSWPDIETIISVSATLRDRIKRLEVDIKNIEENAKIYATSAEDLTKFTRDANIAEATYTVLIEQVKSQSLAAGFQPETFKVFEYATPPLSPSSPNRKLLLVLGTVVGMVIGCGLALINAMRRGVYYARASLLSDASAELSLKSKSIRRISKKSISDIISLISNRRIVTLDEAALKLANKKVIYVLNSGGQPSASNVARLLATQSAQSGRTVVLCDTTGKSQNEIKEESSEENSDFPTVSIGEKISVMKVAKGAPFFTSNNFNSIFKEFTDRFDQVFVCSTNMNSQVGLMALSEFVPSLVVISGLRKTKKSDIKFLNIRQTIDLLFYD